VSQPISVLVVDDSALMRNLVSKIVASTPGLAVADRAMNGRFALQKIPRCDPDVIVLDIEMPEMNGIEFLRERKRLEIEIPVIILSSVAKQGAQVTMEALALGASDFVTKPSGSVSSDIHTVAGDLGRLLLAYGSEYRKHKGKAVPHYDFGAPERLFEPAPVHEERLVEKPAREALPKPLRPCGPIEVIAIGISTGGPNALREVFSGIDADLPQPILVVQHMPAGFTTSLANALDEKSPLIIREARGGDILRPGYIYLAPGGRHLSVRHDSLNKNSGNYVCTLSDSPPLHGCRPSVDILFNSLAENYEGNIIAVILTGMGEDGRDGVRAMKEKGYCFCITQDEATSVVYGMPAAVVQAGLSDLSLPLQGIAARVNEMARRRSTAPV